MLTPTLAALFGSIATAVAIFGGGLAVEAYKRQRDRAGMALALAGAIDALLGLIETRRMIDEFEAARRTASCSVLRVRLADRRERALPDRYALLCQPPR